MRLTGRDLQIVHAVYQYELLTTQQLALLFFPSLHQAYARLSQLYHHGFLERQFLGVYADKMNTPLLYSLAKRGAQLLQAELGLEVQMRGNGKRRSPLFLEHAVAINHVRVSIAKACQETDEFGLSKWLSENELKADYDRVTIRTVRGRARNLSLIPDSYFCLQTPLGVAHFFLELDRGTMTTQRFQSKILAYDAYYASGAYQRRYQAKSLRVLTVTLSAGRMNNLRRVTERVGGQQRYWFTTLDQISPKTVLQSLIWQVATQPALQPLVMLRAVSMIDSAADR
jgi:hypothetical protein